MGGCVIETATGIKDKIRVALRLDRAVRFVWQAGPWWTVANGALVLLQGVLPLATVYLMKLIIDAVTLAVSAPDKGAAFRHVVLLIAAAAAVALFNALLQMLGGLVREAQSLKVTDHMYDVLHRQSIRVDLAYYENPQYYDTLHRAQQEGPYRPTRIVDGLLRLGQSAVSLLAMVGLLISFHWAVALVLFFAAFPGIVVRIKYAGRMFRWQRQRTASERRAGYFNWILTGQTHAKEIRLFGLGERFKTWFNDLRRQLRTERFRISRGRSYAELAAQGCATVAVFATFIFIAYRAVNGLITLGDMVMFYQAFQRGLGYLRELLGGLANLYEDNLFLSNLFEFLDLTPRVQDPASPKPVPRPIRKGIVFDRVDFQYPGSNRTVLKEISLNIEPGKVIALVGENGSGKTTLIKLLCRLYDPVGGSIFMDGVDLRGFNTTELRSEISVIFQDYAQYYLTARENIWLGQIGLPPDDEKIETAAAQAGIDPVLKGLPNGYDTVLGKWIEDGEELSIGEWQKVALARAFLREAQLMVLDEPTSALDAKSEYDVFNRFRSLVAGRTAILISHRFSTVRMADHIYVFDGGRITEEGPHADLMEKGGKYAVLFEKQARFYR